MAHGGVKFLRGAVSDYVAYFLSEDHRGCLGMGYYGDGRAWTVDAGGVSDRGAWTPTAYAAWLSGVDPTTGEQRGSKVAEGDLRAGVRGYEFSVNVPKSASVVAALDPQLGQVLMGAQERAAQAGLAALRAHARVRVEGPRLPDGSRTQALLEVEELEAAVFAHEGSRDGDPHHHLHVQVGAKAYVAGRWRALAGRVMLAGLGEWQATVAASLATDEQWTRALAERGLTVGADGGVVEVSRAVEVALSSRDQAIRVAQEELTAAHVATHGRSPNAREAMHLHQKAWEATRAKKGERALLGASEVAVKVAEAGGQELLDALTRSTPVRRLGGVDVAAAIAAGLAVARETELLRQTDLAAAAAAGVATAGGVTTDLGELLAAVRAGVEAGCERIELPGGQVRWMPVEILASATSVHEHLSAMSAAATAQGAGLRVLVTTGLTDGQVVAAEAVAAGLPCVIEGPAGTGKTTALRAALAARTQAGLATFAVSKSAAAVSQLGDGWTGSDTADGMLTRAGWTRGTTGAWQRPTQTGPAQASAAAAGAVLVVDEAAMMDLPTLGALCEHATATGMRVVLVGDDRQLAAVGAAGGFTLAARGLDVIALSQTKRFSDPNHEQIAAAVRSETDIDQVAAQLIEAGLVVRHDSEADARVQLAQTAVEPGAIVMAGSNEAASAISALARAERAHHGHVEEHAHRLGMLEENIGVGDLVQTRRNDRDLGVRNRDRFVVTELADDGGLIVAPVDSSGTVRSGTPIRLPGNYVAAAVHHADAVTVHAAQGATGTQGHALVDDTWTREQLYVALTRGRDVNTLHVVAETDAGVEELLRGVLAHTSHTRGAQVADIVQARLTQARTEMAPGLTERITTALGKAPATVGAWGSSMFGSTPADPPPPLSVKGGPVL